MSNNSSHLIAQDKKNRILLTQRRDVPFWVIPGGHIEKSESPKKAAIREFKEETGLCAKDIKLLAKYKTENNNVKFLFKGAIIQGEMSKGSETKNISWYDPSQLPKPMSLYEMQRITDFLNYNGKVKLIYIKHSLLREILNLAKNPPIFFKLLIFYIHNQTIGSRSFKLRF